MAQEDEFLQSDIDDEKTIEYIKNYLPQELKYYSNSDLLDKTPDEDGYIDIDLEKIVDYIVKEARKDEMGEYDPEDILFIVQGELEYAESLGDE